jgi:hypothetical protein
MGSAKKEIDDWQDVPIKEADDWQDVPLTPTDEVPAEQDTTTAIVEGLKAAGEKFIVKPVAAVGRQVDRFTTAPTRSGLEAALDGQNPVKAFASQFGEEPELAPTMKEIAAKSGYSTEETLTLPFRDAGNTALKASPAGVLGFAGDVLVDPTNLIPGSLMAKGAVGGSVKAAGMAGKVAATATDVVTGGTAGAKVLGVTKRASEAVKLAKTKLFNPKVASDFEDLSLIAGRNEIPVDALPASIEFGPDSIITRLSRVKAEGPLGQAELEKFSKGLDLTRQATEKRIATIAGGVVPSKQEAGAVLREGYAKAQRAAIASSEDTYGQIAKRYPDMTIDDDARDQLAKTLASIEERADDLQRAGVTSQQKGQARQLKEAVEVARANSWTFGELQRVLKNVGDAAYSKETLLLDPPDRKALREMYGGIREALTTSVRKNLGAETADSLVETNARIAKFLDDRAPLERTLANPRMSDEALFSALVENGDSGKIAALREILPPEELQQLKGAFLDSILRKDFEDNFTFRGVKNRMKTKETLLEALLEPEEYVEFADLVRLGDRFGQPVMSTSGTGASNMLKDIKDGTVNAIINDAFVEQLKANARAGGGASVADAIGKIKLDPTNPGHWNQLSSSVQGSRGGLDRSAKRAQMVSVAPFEINEQRREEMRAMADAEAIAAAPPAAILQSMSVLGTSPQLQRALADALQSGGVYGLRETALMARRTHAIDLERLAKAADLVAQKPPGKQVLTPEEVQTLDAIRIFDPVQIAAEVERLKGDTSIPSTQRFKAISDINRNGYLMYEAPKAPAVEAPPPAVAPQAPADIETLLRAIKVSTPRKE